MSLYLYDKAICKDLENSFKTDTMGESPVRVISPDAMVGIVAQIQDDRVKLPIVCVTRPETIAIDSSRWNFTKVHTGVYTVTDPKTNNLYYEKSVPISLSYNLTVLSANQADRDELIKELIFKYYDTYFIQVKLPYGVDRKIRFGVVPDFSGIEYASNGLEYLGQGKLYQAILPLRCEGCNLFSWEPVKVQNMQLGGVELIDKKSDKKN